MAVRPAPCCLRRRNRLLIVSPLAALFCLSFPGPRPTLRRALPPSEASPQTRAPGGPRATAVKGICGGGPVQITMRSISSTVTVSAVRS